MSLSLAARSTNCDRYRADPSSSSRGHVLAIESGFQSVTTELSSQVVWVIPKSRASKGTSDRSTPRSPEALPSAGDACARLRRRRAPSSQDSPDLPRQGQAGVLKRADAHLGRSAVLSLVAQDEGRRERGPPVPGLGPAVGPVEPPGLRQAPRREAPCHEAP